MALPGAGAATSTRRGWRSGGSWSTPRRRLTSIEINGSFYSLQRPSSYAAWRGRDPRRLRVLGQGTALRHPPQAAGRRGHRARELLRLRACSALGPKLGPVLWQLPENLRFDADVLDAFLARLPRTTGAAADARRAARRQGQGGPLAHRRGDTRPAGAARAGVPQPDVRHRRGGRRAAPARRGHRARRHRRPVAAGGPGDQRLRVRPAARRQGALHQRLHRRVPATSGPRGAARGRPTGSTCSSTSTTTSRATPRTTRSG